MPTNVWHHAVYLTDLVRDLNADADDANIFEPLRDQLADRLRRSEFYNDQDIVVRSLVNDIAEAANLSDLGRDMDLLMLWGDQPEHRVWFETSTSLNNFNKHQRDRDWPEFTTALPPAFNHPVLRQALDTWCEQTGTDPDEVATDTEFAAISAAMTAADLLGFRTAEGYAGRMTPTAYQAAAHRAALVLLAGAELTQLRKTPVTQATARVIHVVTNTLGTPTGYEGQPDLLARHIHMGTASEEM